MVPDIKVNEVGLGFPLGSTSYIDNIALGEFTAFHTLTHGETGSFGVYFNNQRFDESAFQEFTTTAERVATARIFTQTPNLYQDKNTLKVILFFSGEGFESYVM